MATAVDVPPSAIAVDEARDRVYVTAWGRLDRAGLPTGSGTLSVLDARDGTVCRTLAAGVAPQAVGVLAGSGRVVVVGSGGAIRVPQGWVARWGQQVAAWAPGLRQFVPRVPELALVPGSVRVIDPGL